MKKRDEILATLTDEDKRLWRMNGARLEAMKIKPEAYSREEIEQVEYERMRLGGEIIQRYGIDPALDISIQTWTGTVNWAED